MVFPAGGWRARRAWGYCCAGIPESSPRRDLPPDTIPLQMMLLQLLVPLAVALPATTPDSPLATTATPQDAEAKAADAWTGSVSGGALLSTGNNKSRSATVTAGAERKVEENRVTLGALWNYTEENDVLTQRNIYGTGQYDRFLTEKAYAYINASGEADRQAGVDLRWTGGAGMGYQFRDDESWKASGELGISYVDEAFNSGLDSQYASARAGYKTAYLASDKWEFAHDGLIFPSLEDGNDVYTRFDTRVKTSLTDSMFAQLQWIYNWDNTPETGKVRDDHLFLLTVGWSF